MSDIAIKVENVSKQYRLGQIGTGTLSHDLNRWWAILRGKEDPTLKIGQENVLNSLEGDYVWALKNITLEIKHGEIFGIIGKNGAGKSTLLKILSRVSSPTIGTIKVKGRMASLLEVGTGFHPELTGKENIFLNGAILGMSKTEIKSKLDAIIEFAGIAKYLETPLKRYSSGMYVRLAFAVAAHLDFEILIVDEVLAVGDAEFQAKAIDKMQDVTKENGKTVLFVSHDMKSIRNLCSRTALLENGKITNIGPTELIINQYLETNRKKFINLEKAIKDLPQDETIEITEIKITQTGVEKLEFNSNLEIEIKIAYQVFQDIVGLRLILDFCDKENNVLFRSFHDQNSNNPMKIVHGKYISTVIIPHELLGESEYLIIIHAGIHNIRWCFNNQKIEIPIKAKLTGLYNRAYPTDNFIGKLGLYLHWENKQIL